MPYKEHPSCKTPKNRNLKIWRYMDFTKFVAMLEDQALFFANLSLFRDPFEGIMTSPTVEQFLSVPEGVTIEEAQRRLKVGEYNLGFMRWARALLHVSAWHMSEYESAAMWELYLKSGEGVAIQSTIADMILSFSSNPEEIHIGAIEYVDYEKDKIDWTNVFSPAMYKRKSYEHEKELRAIIMSGDDFQGKVVKVDIDVLINRVYVAPNSQRWFYELIKKTLLRYGISKKIINSEIDKAPLY